MFLFNSFSVLDIKIVHCGWKISTKIASLLSLRLKTARNAPPTTSWEKCFLHPFVHKRREMTYPVLTKVILQPSTTAAMCYHPKGDTHPHPPIPPFLLAQNLSSNWIAPTDNMRPKCLEVKSFKCNRHSVYNKLTTSDKLKFSWKESFTFHGVSSFSKNVSRIRNTESFKVWP